MVNIINGLEVEGDLPVLYSRGLDSVILSDVHIGYEEEMASKGIFLPRIQKKRFITIYKKAIEIFHTNKIIINGDMKHRFNALGRQEKEDLSDIFKDLRESGLSVKLVKGNHDNYISLVAEKFDNVDLLDQIEANNLYIFHGHREVEVKENVVYVIGHEHPRLSLRDKLGFAKKFPCFLLAPLGQNSFAVVLPALGIYQSGNDVSLAHSGYMSPIMKKHAVLEKTKPYVIVENEGIMEFPELGLLKNIIF
ncbi:metallophosphoesterase [Metallosphaera tengchongensis]|uniref:Metallophosphoesterase n=1 Tax=Metallosphaera tengchongensis TaxID=1532350 RepID=A0A6N0NT65_9CREN|nr:metallophosphoesterase [Metallosphaera tengchongensis]QKQ99374.1 metallophosphoesterase [Metallosphaera tengchongensis]